MGELSLIKRGGGGAKVYTEADCTMQVLSQSPVVTLPSGVVWGDVQNLLVTFGGRNWKDTERVSIILVKDTETQNVKWRTGTKDGWSTLAVASGATSVTIPGASTGPWLNGVVSWEAAVILV